MNSPGGLENAPLLRGDKIVNGVIEYLHKDTRFLGENSLMLLGTYSVA